MINCLLWLKVTIDTGKHYWIILWISLIKSERGNKGTSWKFKCVARHSEYWYKYTWTAKEIIEPWNTGYMDWWNKQADQKVTKKRIVEKKQIVLLL